eukprot:TRINITY_DN14029_c0_g2_i1.p1 TRINITY_DN14029_c0_g2~~TRINITY_DN14029_c0_g2_i1.p1  ORF type:complete len:591 (+),score=119.03 TRINITY_DN14029_c0_g2_i1:245-1774(+)
MASPKPGQGSGLVYLGRAFNDVGRQGSLGSSIFSLVATMVGGGVLSLPYAMSQCGLALGTVALLVSGAASGWTMDMMVECARRTGCDSFELVGHAAFGERGRSITIALVFVICWLTMIAYFVLLADLLFPLVDFVAPDIVSWAGSTDLARHGIILAGGLLLSPMCFKNSLSSLRFLCFASVGSVVFVATVIISRAAPHVGEVHVASALVHDESLPVVVDAAYAWWPADWWKALYVFPMFGVSFLCHFNALPTHQELQRPTRSRMRRVFGCTMIFTTLLYLLVGVSGYVYGGACTCGNILLNFATNDALVACSRGALSVVLMLNFPLICQPCRNAFFRLCITLKGVGNSSDEKGSPLLSTSPNVRVYAYSVDEVRDRTLSAGSIREQDVFRPKEDAVRRGAAEPCPSTRHALTASLLGSALLVSCLMKSILVVWSVLGSTVAFMVAFILPAAFWLRIVGATSGSRRRVAAQVLLVVTAVLALACTVLTCLNLDAPPCPPAAAAAAQAAAR